MPILPFFAGYIPAIAVVLGLVWGGPWLAIPSLLVWVIVPLADHFGGIETRWGEGVVADSWRYRWLVRAWAPLQIAIYGCGIAVASSSDYSLIHRCMTVFNMGLLGGATGITFAHEMMHRARWIDRALAEVLMTSVTYPWFCVEHVHGHHKRVATPEDPATSRYGEPVYRFLFRSYFGGLGSAMELQEELLKRRNRSKWHATSAIWRYGATTLCYYSLAGFFGGWSAVVAVIGLSVTAVGMLEGINYLEHYGLVRKQEVSRSGKVRYERVRPHHSWNSSHRVSNFMLLNLARHSDHHAHASRAWERLRHIDNAPQLPSGYGAMFLLAFLPPLWFRVMNPLVIQWRIAHGVELPEQAQQRGANMNWRRLLINAAQRLL